MIKFKNIRSKVSKNFTETQQMKIIVKLSSIFWFFRKYFLGVELDYDKPFLDNWAKVKNFSSLDKERNYSLYQLIKIHNEKFKDIKTNAIEFGVSAGSSLITISKFIKKNTDVYGVDSFGEFSKEIKELSTSSDDKNYLGKEVAFNINTRFKDFNLDDLQNYIKNLKNFKNNENKLIIIKGHFPSKINKDDYESIKNIKYSFCYLDFDLKKSTFDALEFILPRLEKGAFLLIDDYNFINQEGCKLAVNEFGLNINSCFQTQSGQLIYINN